MTTRKNQLRETTATSLNGQAVGEVKPLKLAQSAGDEPASQYEAKLAEIEAKKQEIAQANQARQQEMTDLVEAEKRLHTQKQEARKREKTDLRNLAKHYREMAAASEDRRQADELLRWAMECDEEARHLIIEGEVEPEAQADPRSIQARSPWWASGRVWAGIASALGIVAILLITSEYFHLIREQILAANKALPGEQQMQPYDMTSFQKLAYEKLVQFSDLPVALLLLLLVMPPVGLYVLPFWRGKPDFWTEFKTELTPWQRCELASRFVLGFLLLAALAHLVKL